MSNINLKGLVQHIKNRTSVYTPLIEAVVNSMQSIQSSHRQDGKIVVKIIRSPQTEMALANDGMPQVTGFEIEDNGIGFTKENRESFDTVCSDLKTNMGGKGFGRFTFLKYFQENSIKSIYKQDGVYYERNFIFGHDNKIIGNENNQLCINVKDTQTKIRLLYLKEGQFDKKLETISRKVLEKLLIYFIDEKYKCPQIIFKEEDESNHIILNDYLKSEEGQIKQIVSKEFALSSEGKTEKFTAKVFKIFYPDKQKSRVSLTAHSREVEEWPLSQYIPEFAENFFENYTNEKKEVSTKDYMIKTYVLGDYLDLNVSLERVAFNFPVKNDLSLSPLFSEEEIAEQAALITESSFPEEILSRKNKKKEKIDSYINAKAPWHKSYINELDLSKIPFILSDLDIEMELQRAKFKREQSVRIKVGQIIGNNKVVNNQKEEILVKVEALVKEITTIGQGDLAHYIALRKIVIDLFKKSLQFDTNGQYKKEDILHNIIFPTKEDSSSIPYEDHNLWLIDEKLNFTEFISSDKPLEKTGGKRPDLLIFNRKLAFRENNEAGNPIIIFEFKRPQRDDFTNPGSKEDPVEQIVGYINQIRRREFTTPEGRDISISSNTPFYGYVICDLTQKVQTWLRDEKDFKEMPDGMGWFHWKTNINLYIEVLSWDKVLKDAELRNKIFFKKLGII